MILDGFPKSYLLKECRSHVNSFCHIKRTPGRAPGAQFSFPELLQDLIRNQIKQGRLNDGETVKVKLSGDGARMSRVTTFILFSCAILQSVDDLLSSRGNHTIAVISGSESRETLEESLSDVIVDVNAIQKAGYIDVDGRRVPIEFFLGGDYKFLLLVLGLSAANSTYACLWCKVHKKERGDITKPDRHYDVDPMKRTLEEMVEMAKMPHGENYCCVHQPLLMFPLDNVVLDELHLMLRITDILIGNIIKDAMQWDDKDVLRKKKNVSSGEHLKKLVDVIRSCGISFSVWEKRNADNKGSGMWDWTSLMGDDRKTLLRELPAKLEPVLQPDTAQSVVQLWKEFADMYFNFISSWEPTDLTVYRQRIKEWIEVFSKVGDKRAGYKKENVTCYMHAAAYYVSQMVQTHQNIKQFSGQGVEKNNDDARRILQRKSNHVDDPAEVLRAEFRLGMLKHRERQPRKYTKKFHEYWSTLIKNKRANPKRISYGNSDSSNQGISECVISPQAQAKKNPQTKPQRKRKSNSTTKSKQVQRKRRKNK